MRVLIFVLITSSLRLIGQNSAILVYGVFEHRQNKYLENGTIKSRNGIAAYFFEQPSSPLSFGQSEKVNWVKFNNIKLKEKNSTYTIYAKSEKVNTNVNHNDNDGSDEECNTMAFATKNWTIKGKKSTPDMNFIYAGQLPIFDVNSNLLRDTLKKSDTLFVTINNVSSTDSIVFKFVDRLTSTNQNIILYKVPNYTNTYSIPPSALASLSTGFIGYITIEAFNQNYQVIQNKTYLFKNSFTFTKTGIVIKN